MLCLDFKALIILGIAPALLSSVQQIALDIVRPSAYDVRRALSKAVMQSPTFELDPDTVFTTAFLPLLPTAAVTTILIAVTAALYSGAAYHRTVRRVNGQPASLGASLRAAARRVLPCLGWSMLALAGACVLFLLCQLPGWINESPWLNAIGPVLGVLEFLGVLVIVTYGELRFREDPTTSTATLAREVPV